MGVRERGRGRAGERIQKRDGEGERETERAREKERGRESERAR